MIKGTDPLTHFLLVNGDILAIPMYPKGCTPEILRRDHPDHPLIKPGEAAPPEFSIFHHTPALNDDPLRHWDYGPRREDWPDGLR